MSSFRDFALGEPIQASIEAMGITKPTPIQSLSIQPILDGRDLIAKAETGTGKTLAFGAPMMSKIDPGRASVLGLVLCPTRELAQQVAGVLETLGKARGIKIALVVGGEPTSPQIAALRAGAQVVVGTPGRVIDIYGQRFLSFPWTEFVVLDEADQMLEIGFIDDVRKILSYTPDERQTLLFSATFPNEVLKLARESTRNPMEVATAAGVATVKTIEQSWMAVSSDEHSLALIRLIERSAPDDVFLVFCDRRTQVDSLMRRLERQPFSIKALHGGYDQPSRFRVMSAFRTGEVKALVATDVASRGLDVAHVTHVVNYSVPQDVSDYTHRIGRTGRAGRTGIAITLVTPESAGRWRQIEKAAPWPIPQVDAPSRGSWRSDEPRGGRDDARREPRRPREPERSEVANARPERMPARAERSPARPERVPARIERSPPRADRVERPQTASERARSPERRERSHEPRERPIDRGAVPEQARGGARHRAAAEVPPERGQQPRRPRGPLERPSRDPGEPHGRAAEPRRREIADVGREPREPIARRAVTRPTHVRRPDADRRAPASSAPASSDAAETSPRSGSSRRSRGGRGRRGAGGDGAD